MNDLEAATSTFDQREYRKCLGSFATGVTIVTTQGPAGKLAGMTVNSFSSVSLDPPLILWSAAVTANSLPLFEQSQAFVINILGAEQRTLSDQFSKSNSDKWLGVRYRTSRSGCPVLDGALASLHCDKIEMKRAGDHYIFIGHVRDIERGNEADPLIFFNGRYQ